MGKCGFALLVIQSLSRMSPRGVEILKTFEPHLVEKKVTNKRPGTKVLAENALMYKFKYGSLFSSLIQNINDHLYSWLQPNFPEDLCLLRENEEIWFLSSAHKNARSLFLKDEEKNDLVQNVPELGRILTRDKNNP